MYNINKSNVLKKRKEDGENRNRETKRKKKNAPFHVDQSAAWSDHYHHHVESFPS